MTGPKPAGRTASPRSPLADRRALIRYPADLETFCQPAAGRMDADVWWHAQVRDLCAAGIGLVLNRHFEPGTLLTVELPNTKQSPLLLLLARVVHTSAQADGGWLIGCEFATRLSDGDLCTLTGGRDTEPDAAAAVEAVAPSGSRPNRAEVPTRLLPRNPGTR